MDLKHQQSCEGAQREKLCVAVAHLPPIQRLSCACRHSTPWASWKFHTHPGALLEMPKNKSPHKHIPKDNDKKGSMHKSQILCSLTSVSDLFISHLCCHLSGGCDYQVFQLTLVGAILQFLNCNNPLLSIPS